MVKLDKINKAILQEKYEYPEITLAELARRVNLSVTPCWKRLQRLRSLGFIKTITVVHWDLIEAVENGFKPVDAYTDYPIVELGDKAGERAPIREIKIVAYDRDKYVEAVVEGVPVSFKIGYAYKNPGVYGQAKPFKHEDLDKPSMPRDLR